MCIRDSDNIYQRSELDWLIYNDPAAYADLVLNGDPETYLKTVTEYKPLDLSLIHICQGPRGAGAHQQEVHHPAGLRSQRGVHRKPAHHSAGLQAPPSGGCLLYTSGAEDAAAAQPADDTAAAAEETPLTDPARMTANNEENPM